MRSILTALQEGRLFELQDVDKDHALEFLARVLDTNPDIEAGSDALEEIKRREQACNTGIGMGVAVPHMRARREDGELFCAIGWSAEGIQYDSQDNAPVHLVLMYYIPGSQKNTYLKEISTLVKAMKNSGGIGPIATAPDLNVVRNLMLDWVTEIVSGAGPEAVARMIKLEVKQAQAPLPPTSPAPAVPTPVAETPSAKNARAMAFSIVVAPPNNAIVLSPDADWTAALEKETTLVLKLSSGRPFIMGGRTLFVTGCVAYPGGRLSYQCVALTL
jgi:mannitol/fructose-specific phosphotransferase system IIA component (Ntr-type)